MKDPLNPQIFETPQSEQRGERRKEIQELSINSIARSRTWLLEFMWLYKSLMLLYISQSIARMHHQMGIKATGKARNDIFEKNQAKLEKTITMVFTQITLSEKQEN